MLGILVSIWSLVVPGAPPRAVPANAARPAAGHLAARLLRAKGGQEATEWNKRYGASPKGYIMYDVTGHMMVGFEKMPPPPKFASGDGWNPTADEARAVYLGYISYFGTYTVDEAARAVTHHVEGSLNPSYFGTDQLRPAKLEGDRLILSDGKTFRVVWERVR